MKKIINYSGIPALILMAALVFLPVSCNKDTVKENPNADNSSQLIKVSGEDAGTATKTTLAGFITSWNATGTADKVGVYCAQSSGGNNVNIPYTASSTGVSSAFTGAMTWGTGTHYFYAYYPYLAGIAAVTAIPISLAPAQTQTSSSSHIGTYDFMVATPLTAESPGAGTSTTVNFHYNHVFSILEFNILSDNAEVITEVKLTAPSGRTIAFTGGTVDITQSTPVSGAPYTITGMTGSSNKITLTITPGVTLTNSTSTTPSIYMMILPGDLSADNISISIKANGTDRVLTKTGKNFLSGKKYKSVMTTDIDGNMYNTITIGTQTWMAENLKTTKYNDGTLIPNVTDNTAWAGLSTGAYCDYDNTPSNSTTYGRLYNWYAVDNNASTKDASNGSKNICPAGWHVPTDTEWTTLTTYLGGLDVAGGKLKETGTTHWNTPNTDATNSSGFTALPGGYRFGNTFTYIGTTGYWWSLTEDGTGTVWTRYIYFSGSSVYRVGSSKAGGFSVRCIRDVTEGVIPQLTSTDISSITSTTAVSGGNISDGGTGILARGVCWSTSAGPTIANSKTSDGTATGAYTSSISGLTLGNTYYVRAYATNSAGTAYGNEKIFMALAIGDSYQGGKVAYILQSGDPGYVAGQTHGLIAAPSDQSTSIQWYNGSYTTTGATATALGTGNANTNTIVTIQGIGSYAAQLCADLVLGVYSDWYLPSQDELSKLYLNKGAVGDFASADYWSSSENDISTAWMQHFGTGTQNYRNKTNTNYVRAIRAF